MAFGSANGYTNLPNGNFSPVIYSKQVQLAFRKSSVVEDITNSDYFGEIANMGDSVKIIKWLFFKILLESNSSINFSSLGSLFMPLQRVLIS